MWGDYFDPDVAWDRPESLPGRAVYQRSRWSPNDSSARAGTRTQYTMRPDEYIDAGVRSVVFGAWRGRHGAPASKSEFDCFGVYDLNESKVFVYQDHF